MDAQEIATLRPREEDVKKLLADPDTFGFVVVTIAFNHMGQDLFDEEPEAVIAELEERYRVDMPEELENKLQASLLSMTTDLFYTNPNVYKSVTLALNSGDIGSMPDGGDEELHGTDCLWSIVEVALLNGTTFAELNDKLSDSVVNTINDVLDNEAEDLEEQMQQDDVDTIEEAVREPYYHAYTGAQLIGMCRQLARLGVPFPTLLALMQQHGRLLDEESIR